MVWTYFVWLYENFLKGIIQNVSPLTRDLDYCPIYVSVNLKLRCKILNNTKNNNLKKFINRNSLKKMIQAIIFAVSKYLNLYNAYDQVYNIEFLTYY